MSEANFAKLAGAAFLQRLSLHTTLINEGDLPDFLHFVAEGSVEMFSTHNGHETTMPLSRAPSPSTIHRRSNVSPNPTR